MGNEPLAESRTALHQLSSSYGLSEDSVCDLESALAKVQQVLETPGLSSECQQSLRDLFFPATTEPAASLHRSVLAEVARSLHLKPVALATGKAPTRKDEHLEPRADATGPVRPGKSSLHQHRESLVSPSATEALPRYQDLGLIGTGGMGEVRRVLDRDLNRNMAMKVIQADLLKQASALARFLEEAQTTAQLEHPAIVPVHELGQLEDGRFYFTMKEVKGRNLKAVIQDVHRASPGATWEPARSGWTFRRLIDAFYKVCEAVAYAHSRGVVHRDLKPSNVMVGSYGEVMVVDWGLARVRGFADWAARVGALEPVLTRRARGASQASYAGSVSGTPAYMPPEQARGEVQKLGPRSDVYALGAILYEILSNRPPYEGPDGLAILGQVLAGPPVPPGRRLTRGGDSTTLSANQSIDAVFDESPPPRSLLEGPPIPEELEQICNRAMARDSEKRYRDASALAEELSAWLEDAQRRERGKTVVEQADAIKPEVTRLREEARVCRQEAQFLLREVAPTEDILKKKPGWRLEDQARQLEREADLKEIEYLQTLRGSLTHVPNLPEAHRRLADYYRQQHAAAEAARDDRAAAQHEILLRAYDSGHYSAYLKGDGALTVVTDPPGARVSLYRYQEMDRRMIPQFLRDLGCTPLESVTLPMGSYLLKLEAEGRVEVRYPVSIDRLEHWDGIPPGEQEPAPIYLPRISELGPDEVYVPPGWFRSGGDREAYFALERQKLWVDGFCMRRFPVTNLEYVEFLNALVADGKLDLAERYAPQQREGEAGNEDSELYARAEDGSFYLPQDESGRAWLTDYPVFLVDWHCARAFARWEAARDGEPWRLPGELEWEKAARGVDGRYYPWGNFVDPTWACALESQEETPRPSRVDSYPIDESPYGVRGVGGNVRDWCRDVYQLGGPKVEKNRAVISEEELVSQDALRVIRGGAWANSLRSVRVAFRSGGPPTDRFALLGFRLARALR